MPTGLTRQTFICLVLLVAVTQLPAYSIRLFSLEAFGIRASMRNTEAHLRLKAKGFVSKTSPFPSIADGKKTIYAKGHHSVILVSSNQAILEISSTEVEVNRIKVSMGDSAKQVFSKFGKPDKIESLKNGSQKLQYLDSQRPQAFGVIMSSGRVSRIVFGG